MRAVRWLGAAVGAAVALTAPQAFGATTSSVLICDVGSLSRLGDGYCDDAGNYNTNVCGWDGGDCCADTCGQNGNTTYDCVEFADSQVCRDETSSNFRAVECIVASESFLGDGFCDGFGYGNYNTNACNWDDGDCCASTCQDGPLHSC